MTFAGIPSAAGGGAGFNPGTDPAADRGFTANPSGQTGGTETNIWAAVGELVTVTPTNTNTATND